MFIGLALARVAGFRLDASLIALMSFTVGVLLGALAARRGPARGRLLRDTTLCQAALILTAITWRPSPRPPTISMLSEQDRLYRVRSR